MKLLVFTDNKKYNMHCEEYKIIWEHEGERIQKSFKKILKLPFTEEEIKLLINAGKDNSNSSGNSTKEPMNFRYNNRCKIGTYLHELSHRIVTEYSLLDIAQKKYNIDDIHQLIDLFLYDVIEDLYGKESAELRVEYESNFDDDVYSKSWEYALAFNFDERQEMLKNIVGELENEKK